MNKVIILQQGHIKTYVMTNIVKGTMQEREQKKFNTFNNSESKHYCFK